MKIEFTTTNGTRYESNDNQTYFYVYFKDVNGNVGKKRIKKSQFEEAMEMDRIEKENAANASNSDLNKPAELNEHGCVDCPKCNVHNCVHRDCMRRNPTNVGGLGECPRLKVEADSNSDEENWDDTQDSRNAWNAVDEITYEVVANAIKSLGKTDKEITEIMAIIGKDAAMVMDFNEATNNFGADEFNSYIKSKLYTILNDDTTESHKEATESHNDSETTENTTETQNAKESKGSAKKKASRKNKNTAYTWSNGGVTVTLTDKQVDFMRHLPDTCFWEDGLDNSIWVDCLCDDIGGQFAGKPLTVGAMVSTICEKGLAVRTKDRKNGKKVTALSLTGLGKAVAKDLGIH